MKIYNRIVRKNVKEEVDKVLKCRDIRHGFIKFRCDKCNISKKIGFSLLFYNIKVATNRVG